MRFIQDFDTIATPLHQLLRKDKFRWSSDDETTFCALQQEITTTPVLQLPAFDTEFIVECDTSAMSFSVILHMGDGAIAFFRRTIAPRHIKLAAYEHELIELVQVVHHW
jgi:hypothetical protein